MRDCSFPSALLYTRVAHKCASTGFAVRLSLGNQEGLQPVPQVQGRCPLTRPAATRLQAFLISFMRKRTDAINVSRKENAALADSLTNVSSYQRLRRLSRALAGTNRRRWPRHIVR